MDDFTELCEIIASEDDPKAVRRLLGELLTPSERRDVAKRWFLMKELYLGKPQRRIAEEMGISLCKITRGSRVLKQDNSEFRRILSGMFDDHLHI